MSIENSKKIDFHVHSIFSHDAYSKPKDIVKYCKLKKIDGVLLADNSIETSKLLSKNIICIPGCEIKTELGEVLGLFIKEKITKNNFFEVLEKIKSQDGIFGVPHPFDIFRRNSMGNNLKKIFHEIDVIEGFNSRCLLNQFNKKAQRFSKIHNIPIIAGSDAHLPREIGNAYTIVNGEDLEEIRKCVLKNKSFFTGKISSFYVHLFTIWKKYINFFKTHKY